MGSTAGQPAPGTESRSERRSEGSGFDINRVVASMIGREKGNAKAVIRHLVREGRRYRNRLKAAEDELALRPEKLADGQVVLSVEDSKKWTALKDITLTPEQVKAALKKKDELEVGETKRVQADLVAKGAKDLGVKRPALLAEQVQSKGFIAEDREVEVVGEDGKRHKEMQVHVRPAADEKAPWRPMQDFLDKDLKDWIPALMADDEENPEGESSDGRREETTVTFPAQRGARGRAPVKDPVVKVIGGKYASPSELRKQSTSQGA